MRSANKEMTTEPLRMGLATNSDSRILLVLRDLGVGEDLDLSTAASRPPSSSFDAWLSQQQRSEGFEGSEGAEKAEGVEGAEGGAGAGTGTLHERLGKGGATLSYFEGVEKPAKTFFYAAAARNGLLLSSSATSTSTSSAGTGANAADANASDSAASVLYVGDQLYEDYQGARRAGLSALLVRRPGAELSQPAREGKRESGQDNVDKVEIVKSLMDVVTYVRRRNGELEE